MGYEIKLVGHEQKQNGDYLLTCEWRSPSLLDYLLFRTPEWKRFQVVGSGTVWRFLPHFKRVQAYETQEFLSGHWYRLEYERREGKENDTKADGRTK